MGKQQNQLEKKNHGQATTWKIIIMGKPQQQDAQPECINLARINVLQCVISTFQYLFILYLLY